MPRPPADGFRRRALGPGVVLRGLGALLCLALLAPFLAGCARQGDELAGRVLVERGAEWRLSLPPAADAPDFAAPGFDDAAWATARAPLGTDQDGLRHEIDWGDRPEGERPVVVWLRHAFQVEDPAAFDGLVLALRADDGARVFLNGDEVVRGNLPGGSQIGSDTRAPLSVAGEAEEAFARLALPPGKLVAGRNLLAVALHNTRPGSDLVFDASLVAQGPGDPAALLRGPYLQRVSAREARVRFETSRPTRAAVQYGSDPAALSELARGKQATRSHEIALSDLLTGAPVHYRVRLDVPEGEGADDAEPHGFQTPVYGFHTAPATGTRAPVRVWVTGDPGTGSKHARAVRGAFERFTRERPADLWITLGDNAYPSGTPMDWQARFFDVYAKQLAQLAFYPAIGNHDMAGVSPWTGKIHYFDALSLPTRAEAGGSPSGSEHYYSYDWGNTHFVVLDSDRSNRRADGPMARWLRLDLLHSQADWKVAYLHHAPFSRGTHYDDREQRSRQIRENFVPILEQAGVDLVISGHSHAYERSHWLAGPHPEGWHFDPGRVLARATPVDGVDHYASKPGTPRGTVYLVAGSAGQIGRDSPMDHPSMAFSVETHGSVVLDIAGCSLTSRFVDAEGQVLDAFVIEKEDRLGTCRGGEPAAGAGAPAAEAAPAH